MVVVNPRRRRRRKSTRAHNTRRRRSHASPRRRRRRNPYLPYALNGRRRRRSHSRRRRNPFGAALLGGRGGKLLGLPIGEAVSVTAGAIGTDILAGYVGKLIPIPGVAGTTQHLLTKAITVAGGSMIVRRFAGSKMGNAFALGGTVSLLLDVYDAFVKPHLPAALGEYQIERLPLGSYEPEFSLGALTTGGGAPMSTYTPYLAG
jgi:hypothetical protein